MSQPLTAPHHSLLTQIRSCFYAQDFSLGDFVPKVCIYPNETYLEVR